MHELAHAPNPRLVDIGHHADEPQHLIEQDQHARNLLACHLQQVFHHAGGRRAGAFGAIRL